MKLDDIEGTKARPRHSPRKNSGGFDNMDYSDITKAQFVTKRVADPLNPTYKARDENGQVIDIGAVDGSLPKVLPPERKD